MTFETDIFREIGTKNMETNPESPIFHGFEPIESDFQAIESEKSQDVAKNKKSNDLTGICLPVILRKKSPSSSAKTPEPVTITLDDSDEENEPIEIIDLEDNSPKIISKSKHPPVSKRKISSSHFYNVTLNPALPLGLNEKQLTPFNSVFDEEVSKLITNHRSTRSRRNPGREQDSSVPEKSRRNDDLNLTEKSISRKSRQTDTDLTENSSIAEKSRQNIDNLTENSKPLPTSPKITKAEVTKTRPKSDEKCGPKNHKENKPNSKLKTKKKVKVKSKFEKDIQKLILRKDRSLRSTKRSSRT